MPTVDAIVVLPGIMGSELATADGRVLWGFSNVKDAVRNIVTLALGHVDELLVTDEDRSGKRRVRATKLLSYPAFLERWGGCEEYSSLLRELQDHALDHRAVLAFPYDWRLSIAHNAALLARRSDEHLSTWREIVRAEFPKTDPKDVKLKFVCHSMGGLVARHALQAIDGLAAETRRLVTLGSPFMGSTKALELLTLGRGLPIPMKAEAARKLAASCPGVHDLLPHYECVRTGDDTARGLTADEVGIPQSDFDEARARWEQLGIGGSGPAVEMSMLAGLWQPTQRWVRFDAGQPSFEQDDGDGTVLEGSARPDRSGPRHGMAQGHGALQKSREGILWVLDQVLDREALRTAGPSAGVGLDLADSVAPGLVTCRVLGEGVARPDVRSEEFATGATVRWTRTRRGEHPSYQAELRPGFHRVTLTAGGEPITKIIQVAAEESA